MAIKLSEFTTNSRIRIIVVTEGVLEISVTDKLLIIKFKIK